MNDRPSSVTAYIRRNLGQDAHRWDSEWEAHQLEQASRKPPARRQRAQISRYLDYATRKDH